MPTESDLLNLLALPNETLSNEYKTWLDLSTNHGKAVLAKAAIALANHGGGVIVMGMLTVAGSPMRSVARPDNVPRYTPDAVNAAINRYADPKMHCDVHYAQHATSGVEHAIISVPPGLVPVISTRHEEGVIGHVRFYIRKPGPRSEEPTTAEEWRTLINSCILAGREGLLESFRAIMHGHSLNVVAQDQIDQLREFTDDSRASWQSRIESLPKNDPARFVHGSYEQSFQILGVEPAGDLRTLLAHLRKTGEVRLTGWGPFVMLERKPIGPVPVGDAIEAWVGHPEEAGRDGRHSDFWRADPNGFLYQIRSHDEDYTEKAKPGTAIDLTIPIWRVGETLLFVARLAKLFGEDPEISIRVQYSGLKGRVMRSVFDWHYTSYDRECFVDTVRMQGQARASVIEDNLDEVLFPLLKPLYEAFDFFPLSPDIVSREIGKYRNNRY